MHLHDLILAITPAPRVTVAPVSLAEPSLVVPPDTPVRPPSSTQVTLGPPNTSSIPHSYDKPAATAIYVRDQGTTQAGPAATKISKTLSSHLLALEKSTVPFSAGLFFSQAGALSRETSSYANEARSRHIPGNADPEKLRPDFTLESGTVNSSATLNIRTNDGDTVSITVVHKSDSKHLNFSFNVEGELSEKERLALEKLATKLGEVSDEFFRSGTAELRSLNAFDSEVFQSFSLSLSKFNGKDYDTFTYDYSVDQTDGTTRLSGQDVFGYSFDISAYSNGLPIDSRSTFHNSLEQYLELIRRAGENHDAESSSVRFMLDGLQSVLANERNSLAHELSEAPMLENFSTGLPDFTATFSSKRKHNPANYTHISSMNLHIGQKTQTESLNGRLLVQQESFYQVSRSHWKALPGLESPDLERGNYIYINEHIRETTTRTLDLSRGGVTDVFVEKDMEWRHKDQKFVDFIGQNVQTREDANKQLVNLVDQLGFRAARESNHYNLLSLLNKSRSNLFRGW